MSSKKSKKSNKSDETKRNVQTQEKAPERYSKEEIISEEELENRIAISGDIRLYLTMHLNISFCFVVFTSFFRFFASHN